MMETKEKEKITFFMLQLMLLHLLLLLNATGIRPMAVRFKPGSTIDMTEAAAFHPTKKGLESNTACNVVYKPIAKLVSRTTVSNLSNLVRGNSIASTREDGKDEKTIDGQIVEIVYKGEHKHLKPQPPNHLHQMDTHRLQYMMPLGKRKSDNQLPRSSMAREASSNPQIVVQNHTDSTILLILHSNDK
ncbi:TTG2 [Salvia divinorum]|uniref:TTG2 n=1 Tax=Salvia divinorum TaxID=28513 RepID=A0ABD1H0E4_SALDI